MGCCVQVCDLVNTVFEGSVHDLTRLLTVLRLKGCLGYAGGLSESQNCVCIFPADISFLCVWGSFLFVSDRTIIHEEAKFWSSV